LPSPAGVETVDLALKLGTPGFVETLRTIAEDLVVERISLAQEIESANPTVLKQIQEIFPRIPIDWVSHEAFKQLTKHCRAIVRTGEATPYANIILHSGVIF
jgi:D-ribose pyranase